MKFEKKSESNGTSFRTGTYWELARDFKEICFENQQCANFQLVPFLKDIHLFRLSRAETPVLSFN